MEYDAIKALEDMTLMVLGAPYGIDKQGQEFTADTDFGDLPILPVVYFHGWGADDGARIGWASKAHRDSQGQWYRVTLDAANEQARKIYEDAKAGLVRASSDAIAHLVRPIEALKGQGGKIARWVIGALSLMDASTYERAINPRAIALPAVRAYLDELFVGLATDSGEVDSVKAGATFARRNRDRLDAMQKLLDDMRAEYPQDEIADVVLPNSPAPQPVGVKAMETEMKVDAPVVTPAAPVAPQIDVEATIKAAMDKWADEQAVKANRPGFKTGDAPNVNKGADVESISVKAFETYMRTGDKSGYSEWNAAAKAEAFKIGDESKFSWSVKAALNEGTTSQGGYLVPTKYSNELVQAMTLGSVMRQTGARQVNLEGTNSFRVPVLTNSTKAILTVEASNYSEVEPTFSEVNVVPYKYTKLEKISEELLADSRFPLMDILMADAEYAFTLAENEAFTIGTGSGQPQGIMIGGTVGTTSASSSAITPEEWIGLEGSLAAQYRPGAVIVMNDSTAMAIRKIREYGTTGDFMWQRGLAGGGTPATFLGFPLYIVPDVPGIAASKSVAVIFNPRYFWIFDWGAMYVQRLNELYAATGQIGLRWYKRFDSHVMLAAAVQRLITPA